MEEKGDAETPRENCDGLVVERSRHEQAKGAPKEKSKGAPPRAERDDLFLVEQMKLEIRKLYGEKANLINTNYIVRPHEFGAMARALERQLWGADAARKIEGVDDLLFAVDSICSMRNEESCGCKDEMSLAEIKDARKAGLYARIRHLFEHERAQQAHPWEEREKALKRDIAEMEKRREEYVSELYTSIRYANSALRQMVDSGCLSARGSPSESIVGEELSELVSIKNDLEGLLAKAGLGSVRDLVREREERELQMLRAREALGLFSGEDLLQGVARVKKHHAGVLEMEIGGKERALAYEKRHHEEEQGKLRLRLVDLEIENKKLRRIVKEKKDMTDEVGERSDSLQEGLRGLKRALEEEGRRSKQEKKEFEDVKRKLIARNRELNDVVRELVQRIKKERRELEAVEEAKEDLKEVIL